MVEAAVWQGEEEEGRGKRGVKSILIVTPLCFPSLQ